MRELWPYFRLMRRRRWWLAGGAALMFATVAASVGLLATAGWFIAATGLAGAALAAGAPLVLDIYRPGAAIRFFAIFRTVSRYFERLVTHEATFRLLADLRVSLFRRIAALDHAALGRLRGGEMLQRLTGDVDTLDHLYLRVVAPIATAAVMLLVALAGFALASPLVAFAGVGVLVAAALGVPVLTARLGAEPGRRLARHQERMRRLAVDGVQGLAELRAFAAADAHRDELDAAGRVHAAERNRMARIGGLANALTLVAGGMAMWLAAVIGIALLAEGAVGGAVLALLVLGMLALAEVVVPLPLATQYLGLARAAARRLDRVRRMTPAVADPVRPVLLPARNELALEDVTFAYGAHDRPILHHARLAVAEGERVAVVGPSGLGKSTLAALLLRRYDPAAGRVTLGGIDLREVARDDLHRRVGCLEQLPHLFNASIAENLWLADDTAPPERLWAALEVAGLADFVTRLPEGLRSHIGETGIMLSGGEARRLALARVILKDSPVVILDEPTIGLDGETERRLAVALDGWLAGRTVVVISHAPQRLFPFDRMLTLRDGNFVPAA